jgi:hypothetical protein
MPGAARSGTIAAGASVGAIGGFDGWSILGAAASRMTGAGGGGGAGTTSIDSGK